MRRLFPGKRGPLATPEIRQRFNVEDLLTAFVRFDDGSACMLEETGAMIVRHPTTSRWLQPEVNSTAIHLP